MPVVIIVPLRACFVAFKSNTCSEQDKCSVTLRRVLHYTDNNNTCYVIWDLVNAYKHKAFEDGVCFGARMIKELFNKYYENTTSKLKP